MKAMTLLAATGITILASTTTLLATTYTWNGVTDTDWGTTTNWTPNGTPGPSDDVTIVSSGNDPVYDGSSGVTDITVSSGTLDLNGYTLTFSGEGLFSGGTITNGRISSSTGTGATFSGTLMDCHVSIESQDIYLDGSTFNDTLLADKTGTGHNNGNGNNRFMGYVSLTNSGTGTFRTGTLYPDTFHAELDLVSEDGFMIVANNCAGTLFGDSVKVSCTTGSGIYVGQSTSSGSKLADGKTISADNFTTGLLRIYGMEQVGNSPQDITTGGDASLYIYYSDFTADITTSTSRLFLRENHFRGENSFTKTGTGDDSNNGGNMFHDITLFTNSAGATDDMRHGTLYPDTFLDKVTLNQVSGGIIIAYSDVGDTTLVSDSLIIYPNPSFLTHVSRWGATRFEGPVLVADNEGSVYFGYSGGDPVFNTRSRIVIGPAGYTSGTFLLRNATFVGSTPQELEFTGSAILSLDTATFNCEVSFTSPRILSATSVFDGAATYFEKSGTANDAWGGGNTFNSFMIEIVNSSSANLTLANIDGDDFNGDVTFVQTSTGLIYPGYNGTTTYAGDIISNGSDNLVFGDGSNISWNVLDGTAVQQLDGTAPEQRYKKLEVDKPSGHVDLDIVVGITDSLLFDDGIIINEHNDKAVSFRDGSKAIDASDASHVVGLVGKKGDEAFAFPVGRNGHYAPISISAPSVNTDEYIANYLDKNSDWTYDHSSKDASIDEISRNEYWQLLRNAGSSDVNVTLSWDASAYSCSLDSIDSLQVVSWNGTQWKDLDNGGTSGTTSEGAIVSNSSSTWYAAFALGIRDVFGCSPCNESTVLGDSEDCYEDEQMVDDVSWYAFTPDSTRMRITVSHPSGNALVGIDSVGLYSGASCNDLTLLKQADIANDTVTRTFLSLVAADLKAGTQYFIKLHGEIDTIFDICLENLSSGLKMGPGDCDDTYGTGNLITNGEFDAGNTGFTSGHQFMASGFLTYGQYRIDDEPTDCNPDFTFVADDYPGGTTDNMMIVDGADNSAHSMVWQQTVAVEQNECYCFSFWVANLSGLTSPQFEVTFVGNVSGAHTESYNVPLPDNGDWVSVGGTYVSQSNTSVTITIRLTTRDQAGNDFAIDHIEMFEGNLFVIEGPENSCSPEQVYSINPALDGNFGWTVPSGATIVEGNGTHTIEVDWGSNAWAGGGQICVTPVRCGEQVCIDVPGCCFAGDLDDATVISSETYEGQSLLGLNDNIIVSGSAITGTEFAVNGTFTIANNLTFDNCDVLMGEDAEIVVQDNVTLTITDDSWLHRCKLMWDNILVEDGGNVVVNQESKIEDAETALLVQDAGTYDVDHAHLIKNYIHLQVISVEGPMHDPGDITSSTFTCPSPGLAPPRQGQTTLRAIDLLGGFAFDCGVTPDGQRNTFENAGVGIRSTGIVLEDWGGISTGPSLTILNNDFEDVNWGIQTNIGRDVLAQDNTMKDIGNVGIFLQRHAQSDIDILENEFSDNVVGAAVMCFNNQEANITVEDNDVMDFSQNTTANTGYGVAVLELAPGNGTSVSITDNTISSSVGGVMVWNLNGVLDLENNTSSVYIGNNTITHTSSIPPPLGTEAGITLSNCFNSLVIENTISNPSSTVNWWETGIRQELGGINFLFCNTMYDIGTGICVSGDVRPTWLVKNSFQNQNHGGLFLNYAIIGAQGFLGIPFDNGWLGTTWSSSSPNTISYTIDGSLSPFFVQDGAPFEPEFNVGQNVGIPITIDDGATHEWTDTGTDCPVFDAPQFLVTTNQKKVQVLEMLSDTINPANQRDSSLNWMGLFSLYNYLPDDDSVLNAETEITDWYDSCWTSNMGKLNRALEALADTSVLSRPSMLAFQDTLDNMSTGNNHVEEGIREVALIIYDNLVDNRDTLTGSQLTDLRALAKKCPYDEGFGVYMARMLVLMNDTLFPDSLHYNSCEALPAPPSPRLVAPGQEGDKEEGMAFSLYPNPNDGLMYLDYTGLAGEAIFELFDITGRQVANYNLLGEAGKLKISEAKLERGIYLYRIVERGNTLYSGKVIIN